MLNLQKDIAFMSWQTFLEKLLKDFRISDYELSKIAGISAPTFNRIRRGETEKPYQNTIKKIEEGLRIKIDDRDPNNITYKRLPDKIEFEKIEPNLHEYPVITTVYGGASPNMFVAENIEEFIILPYEKKENCFAVRVKGDSMNHKVEEGDIILVDMTKEITNGSIVIARLRDGRQLIKRYRNLHPNIMLYSDNGNYEPMFVNANDIEAIYKVVGIWKKV